LRQGRSNGIYHLLRIVRQARTARLADCCHQILEETRSAGCTIARLLSELFRPA
jgi:hypothetical protein